MSESRIPKDEALLEQLWVRFRHGDGAAFDQLTRLRYRTLYNYATKFTKDSELIKDCIQDLFLELWQQKSKVCETPYVTIYLIRALRNNLFRKLKLSKRIDFSHDFDDAIYHFTDDINIEVALIGEETLNHKHGRIRKAIERLPKRQQEVIFLKYYEGLSNEQISEVMDIERQTVSNFVHRALNQLKEELPTLIFSLFFFNA